MQSLLLLTQLLQLLGNGGHIRDIQATGKGANVIAGTVGYSYGNLLMPGYPLEYEDQNEAYPKTFASSFEICVQESNGASEYGNKFGEPIILGFTQSFGQRLNDGKKLKKLQNNTKK